MMGIVPFVVLCVPLGFPAFGDLGWRRARGSSVVGHLLWADGVMRGDVSEKDWVVGLFKNFDKLEGQRVFMIEGQERRYVRELTATPQECGAVDDDESTLF